MVGHNYFLLYGIACTDDVRYSGMDFVCCILYLLGISKTVLKNDAHVVKLQTCRN